VLDPHTHSKAVGQMKRCFPEPSPGGVDTWQEVIKIYIILFIINGLVYEHILRLYTAGIVKQLPEISWSTDF
jgi:hypothetical protein